MTDRSNTPARGRPKTLERDHVLQTALMCYWADGPTDVAISEICLKANASKPGVYREFASDDGLKVAVLEAYGNMVLAPLFDILASDQPFEEVLETLIAFTVQDRRVLGLPDGCLHAAMRAQRDAFGELTRNKVDSLRLEILGKYKDWIDRAKAQGQLRADISTDMAALYFDAQNGSAMRMQKEGVVNDVIEEVLRAAFSVFR